MPPADGGLPIREMSDQQVTTRRRPTPHTQICLLVGVLVVYVLLVSYSAVRHAPAWDEFGHLPAGIMHLRDADYRPYRTNPPLVRMLAALPVLRSDVARHLPHSPAGRRPEWLAAKTFAERAGRRLGSYYAAARLTLLPLLLVGPLCVYSWANSLWGAPAGIAAAVLYCISPTVLAYSALMTPDAVAASMGVAALYCYRQWLQEATSLRRTVLAGLTLGAALATKYTMLLLLPFWALAPAWLRGRYVGRCRLSAFGCWIAQLGIALLLVNAVYRFQGTGTPLSTLPVQSRRCQSLMGLLHRAGVLEFIRVPLPAQFVLGIDEQFVEFERGYWSYLRGTWKLGGWWYYYLYALLVKEPTALWLLLSWSVVRVVRHPVPLGEQILLFGPAALILAVLSSHTGFNHHVRYALPALPFLVIWAAGAVSGRGLLGDRRRVLSLRVLGWSLVGAAVLSSLSQWPHSESYFCWLVGGPRRGAEHLLDSNIDWGQDVSYLARWLRQHPTEQLDGIVVSVPFPVLQAYGLRRGIDPRWETYTDADDQQRTVEPRPGRYAVSVRRIYESREYHYFRYLSPAVWVTPAIRIYDLRSEDIRRLRAHMQSCSHRFPLQ